MNGRFFIILAVTFFSLVETSSPARAATEIVPPRVTLTAANPVGVLTITNDRNIQTGYDIEVFGWAQEPDGKVLLTPTTNIRAEPAALDIQAHGSAKLRVIALVSPPPPGSAEKVYRIRISERPDRQRDETEKDVQVIAWFSLPVFHKPEKTTYKGRLSVGPIADGKLTFAVHNDGTEHTYIGRALVSGQDGTGKEIFSIERQGWYVLAGGKLEFKAAIAAEDCLRSHLVTVTARVLESDDGLSASVTPNKALCGDGKVSEFPIPGLKKMPEGFKLGDALPNAPTPQ